jgi:hypothetical protein
MPKLLPKNLKHDTVRGALIDIASKYEGRLLPADIVEEASDPDHVLHDEFEWNDTEAGHSFRLMQAGALVRGVRLNIIREDKPTKSIELTTTRAFVSRPTQRGVNGYEKLESIMSDEAAKQELLEAAKNDLLTLKRRYENLQQLGKIWHTIDEICGEAV